MATANTTNMERFAYDVFVHSMSIFGIETELQRSKCSDNTYEHTDVVSIVSRLCTCYQLENRDFFKPKFEATFKSNGLRKFMQISELLKELLAEIDSKWRGQPFLRVGKSLALINELIQFLYSKNCKLFLNSLASLWKEYFSGFQKEFEDNGGLSSLYSMRNEESFQCWNRIANYIIRQFCSSYGEVDISAVFLRVSTSDKSMKRLMKAVEDKKSDINKTSIPSNSTRISDEKKTEGPSLLENTGLGIRPHEELLRDISVKQETSAEKSIASSTEGASIAAHAYVKSHQKLSGETSREQVKYRRHPSTQISSEGRTKDLGGLTGSPLSPEGQSKGHGTLAGSPTSPQEQIRGRSSPQTPKGVSRLEQKLQRIRQRQKEPTN